MEFADKEPITFFFDATRLLARRKAETPTGIDRVDLRYALYLEKKENVDLRLGFSHGQKFFVLPFRFSDALLRHLEDLWLSDKITVSRGESAAFKTLHEIAKTPEKLLALAESGPWPKTAAYINCSHSNISSAKFLENISLQFSEEMIFYIHDIIPMTHPEYVRKGDKDTHTRRIENVLQYGRTLLVNSLDTENKIRKFCEETGALLPDFHLSIIGVEPKFFASRQADMDTEPYFVMVGTIEPRKNHLSMLLVWRDLVESGVLDIPKLVVIGRRGWSSENVFALLDECDAIAPHVIEVGTASDAEVISYLSGCKALLFPTFTEGWGMPLAEALAHGVPAIASDIPVLHESGAGIPEYIHPLDLKSWRDCILDYAQAGSKARAEQIERLEKFNPPKWQDSYGALDKVVEKLLTHHTLGTTGLNHPFDRLSDQGAQDHDWEYSKIDEETIEFENWYPRQTDSKGRYYRWNGQSSTARLAIRDRLRDASFLSISVRCLYGLSLDSVLTAVAVNGRQADYREVSSNDLTEIIVDLSNADQSNSLLITFFLGERRRPVDLNLNTDTRSLGFNFFSMSWLSLKESLKGPEGLDSESNP
ncbi:glycosyltransferase family 1 protein [Sulfitobacter sp. HNIBRBA3233]|uniref:glycosyltransferase family 4 protein n=1 Tax=Sulfitobacter marinivivus TaxID=3158558 RepID=UPI0032DF4040